MKPDKETQIMDGLAKNPKVVLLIQKWFNKMDGRCRQMAMTNPNRPFSDYCPRCQKLAKKMFGDKIEL